MNEFEIKDGILTKYNGEGGNVIIPEGVTKIEQMSIGKCKKVRKNIKFSRNSRK